MTKCEKKWSLEVTQNNNFPPCTPARTQCECCVQVKHDRIRVVSLQKRWWVEAETIAWKQSAPLQRFLQQKNALLWFPCLYWKAQRKAYKMKQERSARNVWLKCRRKSLWFLQEKNHNSPNMYECFHFLFHRNPSASVGCSIISEGRWEPLERDCPCSDRWVT